MTTMTLDDANRPLLANALHEGDWMVACLCAEWCDVCTQYRPGFFDLAARWPQARFVWIDVEDQAALVGDYDVENFPTLLIQRGATVVFYGPTLPEPALAGRLLASQQSRSDDELRTEAVSTAERRQWQRDCNLLDKLTD